MGKWLIIFLTIQLFSHPAIVLADSLSVSVNVGTTTLTFSGKISPSAQVTFLENGAVVGTTQADTDGDFDKSLIYFESGIKTVSLYATDSQNRTTSTVSYSTNLTLGQETTISNIILPPTIELSDDSLTAGDSLTVSGEAVPLSTINLFFSNSDTGQTAAAALGTWSYLYSTSSLAGGTYSLYAKASTGDGYQSADSQTKSFTLVALPTATPTPKAGPTNTPAPAATATPTPTLTPTSFITPVSTIVPTEIISPVPSLASPAPTTISPIPPAGQKISLMLLIEKAKEVISGSLPLQILITVVIIAPIFYFILPFIFLFFTRIKIFSLLNPNQGECREGEILTIAVRKFKLPAGAVRFDLETDPGLLEIEEWVSPGLFNLVKAKLRAKTPGKAEVRLVLVFQEKKLVLARGKYLILPQA